MLGYFSVSKTACWKNYKLQLVNFPNLQLVNFPRSEICYVGEAEHFLDCVRNRKTPISDGNFGLRVLRQIESCNFSIKQNGKRIRLDEVK